MHVAVVDEWLPYPVDCGKKLRSFHLLAPLTGAHRITYIAPRSGNLQQDSIAERGMRDAGFEVDWIDRPVPPNSGLMFGPRLARNLLSRNPYSVDRHLNPAMQRRVSELDRRGDIDLWHVEWTPYVENVRGRVRAPWIVNAHNVESLIWRRYRDVEPSRLKSWYFDNQYRKYHDYERSAFAEAKCVVTCTEADAELARTDMRARHVEVVSNGVELDRFAARGQTRDPNELLFLGSLGWRPNLDAVAQLLDTIFPQMLTSAPDLRLSIVGRDPPAWLESRVASAPQVKLHANVPQVEPYLARCGALLVPLRVGGGSRIKILEALAAGCPVISTTVGAEGLHLEPGVDFIDAETVDAFASTALSALSDYPTLLETADSGRRVVTESYEWNELARRLESVWQHHGNCGRALAG